MRQLFLRIFLPVLLTVLLTFAGGFAVAFWIMPTLNARNDGERSSGGPRGGGRGSFTVVWTERRVDIFTAYSHKVADALNADALDTAFALMEKLSEAWESRTFLIDQAGADLRGHEVPNAISALAQRAGETPEIQRDSSNPKVTFAQQVRAADGRLLVFIAQTVENLRGPPPKPSFFWMVFWRTVPVAITLSLVCYFLARTITKPVLEMRSAMRRFGEGDLEQRVGSTVGRRRDEIGELARDFDHMAERIEKLLGAQQRLLEDISHELRSPLARQRVALELARLRSSESALVSLDRVEREAERLDGLIGQLLTLTRLENDACEGRFSPVDLADLVREVVADAQFESRTGKRSVQLTDCSPCTVNAEAELLLRAVENVVRNALSYTADNTTVDVTLVSTSTEAVITVRDHGPGLPESELTNVFQPFYRVSHARDRQSGGVGLGLAIVERAVRTHGGTVVARNGESSGLIVEIRIPLIASAKT